MSRSLLLSPAAQRLSSTRRCTEWRPCGKSCQFGSLGEAAIGELIVRRCERLLPERRTTTFPLVANIDEVEKLALGLPEAQRAVLAAHLLESLSPVLDDRDEGIAEALRRDAELDANPSSGMSLEELDRQIEDRRG